MIRMSRMTDYGVVLLSIFARRAQGTGLTARDLAEEAQLPLPTVSKLLKILCKGELLSSQRGVNGGYQLSRDPEQVNMAQVIELLEGPIAITECSGEFPDTCNIEASCPLKGHWRHIPETIRKALSGLSLSDMIQPYHPGLPQENPAVRNNV